MTPSTFSRNSRFYMSQAIENRVFEVESTECPLGDSWFSSALNCGRKKIFFITKLRIISLHRNLCMIVIQIRNVILSLYYILRYYIV